jgi:hypothetical protein
LAFEGLTAPALSERNIVAREIVKKIQEKNIPYITAWFKA